MKIEVTAAALAADAAKGITAKPVEVAENTPLVPIAELPAADVERMKRIPMSRG
jgi:hypothetical protein